MSMSPFRTAKFRIDRRAALGLLGGAGASVLIPISALAFLACTISGLNPVPTAANVTAATSDQPAQPFRNMKKNVFLEPGRVPELFRTAG